MKIITGEWPEAPLGGLLLQLDRDFRVGRVGGGPSAAPKCYWFQFDSAGALELDERIWGNDELMPEGSRYKMTIFDAMTNILFGPLNFQLCGPSPLNLNRMIQSRTSGGGFTTFGIETGNLFGQPNPNEYILLYTSPFQQLFPPNFANPQSYGSAGIQAAAPAVFTVQLNGSNIGTVTFQPTGIVLFQTAGFMLNPGGRLTIKNPDVMDATLSDVAITLVSTRLT